MHKDEAGPSLHSGRDYTTAGTEDVGRVIRRDMGYALEILRRGGAVARHNWNGPNQRLQLQVPDANSKMSLPYIFIVTVQGDRVPWLASQTDILANDWYERELTVDQRAGAL